MLNTKLIYEEKTLGNFKKSESLWKNILRKDVCISNMVKSVPLCHSFQWFLGSETIGKKSKNFIERETNNSIPK